MALKVPGGTSPYSTAGRPGCLKVRFTDTAVLPSCAPLRPTHGPASLPSALDADGGSGWDSADLS